MTVHELSRYLSIGPREIQLLTKAGVLNRIEKDNYDLLSCTVNYIQYLRKWRNFSSIPATYKDLADLGASPVWVRSQVQSGTLNKISHGKYDLTGIVRAFINSTKHKEG